MAFLSACAATSPGVPADSGTGLDATTGPAGVDGAGPASDAAGVMSAGADGASSDSAVSQCSDGVQDGEETGVDCGGPVCPPCVVSYALNPPNPCDNQFTVAGCQTGVSTSTCGGLCESKNICESGKSGYANGYACSRYMLFSPEFLQAAKDDASEYGWPNPNAPAFNYAVVGHDPDTSGVDQGVPGSCCMCYQIVFVAAQYNDAAAPPPPLIVQTFNSQAGGPKNFDIYMGAGGFGAFDGCSDAGGGPDGPPLYDSFPSTGEPGNGGINVINQYAPVCQTNGQVTAVSIASASCQNAADTDCKSVLSDASATLTSTTRASCIDSNQPATLYHQNYDVVAKRVECPDHLTQVTGCKSPAYGAGPVEPTVTTASLAASDGTFLSGYTNTTMQDCCKPACAWVDNVGDAGIPPWNSFYTCDHNDTPLTQ